MKKILLLTALCAASFAFAGNTEPTKPAEPARKETSAPSPEKAEKKPAPKAEIEDCCAPVEPAAKPAGK